MRGPELKLHNLELEIKDLKERAKEVEWTALHTKGDVFEVRRLKSSHASLLRQMNARLKKIEKLKKELK